ncbi:MAG: hypothetical protein ACJ8D4_14005, partial [Xanthobacteraceae bacterium]
MARALGTLPSTGALPKMGPAGDQPFGSRKLRMRTLFAKIWDSHRVAERADGRDLIYIDRHVLHELHAPHA